MRKISLFMMVSVDGYFEGPHHNIGWHNVDNEFVEFAEQQLDNIDLLLFGHTTYDLMAGFWPSEEALKADPGTAKRMNEKQKIVFSKSLQKADWNHTEVRHSVDTREINKIKELPGKDIAIFGSSNLCISFIQEKLLDELRIMVNPVVLGKGTALFAGLQEQLKLTLSSSRTFKNGNILLTYQIKFD